jgi:hypothetical protein
VYDKRPSEFFFYKARGERDQFEPVAVNIIATDIYLSFFGVSGGVRQAPS